MVASSLYIRVYIMLVMEDDVSLDQEYSEGVVDFYAEEEAQQSQADFEKSQIVQYPCEQCGKTHSYKYGDTCQRCKGSGKNPSDPEGCVECPSCDGMGFYDPHG